MKKKTEYYLLWINLISHIISFHFEDGFEQLRFPSIDEQIAFVRKMSRNGYWIQ